MTPPLISVIIPVYNVEKYISECFDSLKNQTIGARNIEVIVVDDCSPDGSIAIAEQYQSDFFALKIIKHEQNKGQGEARNTGLQHASGSYITFVDPDDKISDNVLEYSINCLEKYQCDIVLYEYDYFSQSGKKYARNPSAILFNEDRLVTDILDAPELIFATSVCNKVFSRKLITHLQFPDTKYEDVIASANTLFRAGKIFITNKCKYYYRKREDNTSTMDNYLKRKENYHDHLSVNLKLLELVKEFPRYKELVLWFNARSFSPFLYGLTKRGLMSWTEKKRIFHTAQKMYAYTGSEILDRLEDPFMAQIVVLTKKHKFLVFWMIVQIKKSKNIIAKGLRVIRNLFNKTWKLLEFIIAYCLSFVYRFIPGYRNAWLISERGYDARDNGYHFFKYLRTNHPEINAYYLISDDNNLDYSRVSLLGNLIKYKSMKHKALFIIAKCIVSAHKGTIEPWNYSKFRKFINQKQKYVFLQHGITKDNVSHILGKNNTNFDLFITGAQPEYQYISNTFGYEEHEVVYTGFPRFDNLKDASSDKKIILLMPTWRNGIVQKSWLKDEIVPDQVFLTSEYYARYQSILRNKQLINLLEKNDYQLIFYPHNEVQQYLEYFSTVSDRIILAGRNDYDVQQLLAESRLLITDYSSVFFDFGYLEKPVLYYQFDRDTFFLTHYKKGYFDYDKHGFGPVAFTEDEMIEHLQRVFDREMELENVYKDRIRSFFTIKDANNSERVFNEIIKIL